MRLILIILFLFLNNCAPKKEVYLCGNNECLNKKDSKEYFKKNLSMQVELKEGNLDKKINLIELNKGSTNNKKNNVKKFDIKNNYLTRSEKKAEKKAIKLEKKIAKEERKDALRAAKFNNKNDRKKTLQKDKIVKKKRKKIFNIFNKKKVASKMSRDDINKDYSFCLIDNKCNIEEISSYINKIGRNKPYPDISNNN